MIPVEVLKKRTLLYVLQAKEGDDDDGDDKEGKMKMLRDFIAKPTRARSSAPDIAVALFIVC